MTNIHNEVVARYFGCGLVSPQLLTGTRILDLGSGSGRDCYLLAQLAGEHGFVDPRLVEDHPITIDSEEIRERIGHISFFSATYRLFKLEGLETHCEDYGQAVVYRGGIAHSEQAFLLDKHHRIEKGRMFPVCGNTYHMLRESRFAPFFEFYGDTATHYGIYDDCGTPLPFDREEMTAGGSTGSCC